MVTAVKRFLAEFTKWTSQRPAILAVVLVGSQARGTASARSDVDLVISVTDPADYLSDTAWVAEFGDPVRHALESYGKLSVCRVWYSNGLEVEFGFTRDDWPHDPGAKEVISQGMKVLLDRGPLHG